MKTLILKTEGMSAFGLQTFDVTRHVSHFPTRSGIIGMLCAAKGIARTQHDKVFELAKEIKIAVQVNRPGTKLVDYHTVQNFRSPAGKIQYKNVKPTFREYMCDSKYTFAVTGHNNVINELSRCVKRPVFGIFQGRRSCPLTRPLFDSVIEQNNPSNVLRELGEQGQIFSGERGEGFVAQTQARDMHTESFRKFAIRNVFIADAISYRGKS